VRGVDPDRLLRGFFWARLGIALLLLAVAPIIPEELKPGSQVSVVAVCLLVVVASSGLLLFLAPLAKPDRIAWLVGVLDAALITAIVAATGGARSIFAFLYVLSVTGACVLLSRAGGLAIAAVSSALYTGLVFGRTVFPVTALFEAPEETTALEVLTMFLNTGTFMIVAIVAGGLAERFHATREELETQRRDLRDIEAFKNLVFQSVGTGLIAIDQQRRITAFNRAAEAITGVQERHAVGRAWEQLFGDRLPLDDIERAVGTPTRTPPRRETLLPRADGTTIPVRMTFSALCDGDGSRVGLICACEDLSAIRSMEEQMRQADRLATLGRMAANIAHEIRNPLASLTGAIEVLASSEATGETRERLGQIVLKESGRLNEIIRGFLEYARPAPLVRAPVSVSEHLDEVLVLLEHRAGPGTLKIVREFPPGLVWSVDAQQFRQAVWNLCLNAFEAMPGGGELRVGATASGKHLEVRIADTGEGIAPTDLDHVFEPFFSTKPDGSGLGLALVDRIVRDHGGRIEVQTAPGAGTTFTLSIPGHA
jgi:two-component system sensor histidine kinase PilS (NtrC family)